jgi:hypothetical protein
MTRYLVGCRAAGDRPAGLIVVDKPPTFYQPTKRTAKGIVKDGHERIHFESSNYGWHAEHGTVKEWRDNETGRLVIARVFPEEFAEGLVEHNDAVKVAEQALRAARKSRQEFLDTVASRAKPVKVAEARRERDEWPTTPQGIADAEAKKAELAKSQEFLDKLNDKMGDFLGKAVNR